MELTKPTAIFTKPNMFSDSIAYLEHYDFSRGNLSNDTRIANITFVASICYQSPKSFGSESLYNRLMAESKGLPSSSFEFIPMLFNYADLCYDLRLKGSSIEETNMLKFGEVIMHAGVEYLLTNFRAVVYDFENLLIDYRDHFNTEAECQIIAKHFKVFKVHVDMPTLGQMVRHRVNWQVLSRRYVSGSRVPFDFYVADQMKHVTSTVGYSEISTGLTASTRDIIAICLEHYKAALAAGVKPQVARGIIPQCAYTVAWCAFQPTQLSNFFKLRDDSHAQWEIQQVALAMKEAINDKT